MKVQVKAMNYLSNIHLLRRFGFSQTVAINYIECSYWKMAIKIVGNPHNIDPMSNMNLSGVWYLNNLISQLYLKSLSIQNLNIKVVILYHLIHIILNVFIFLLFQYFKYVSWYLINYIFLVKMQIILFNLKNCAIFTSSTLSINPSKLSILGNIILLVTFSPKL